MTTGLKRRYVPGTHLAIDSPSFKAKEAKLDSGAAGPVIQVYRNKQVYYTPGI